MPENTTMRRVPAAAGSDQKMLSNEDGSWASEILDEASFLHRLHLEKRRTERSRNRFVLMLLDSGNLVKAGNDENAFQRVASALSRTTREVDIRYTDGTLIGVIFTEIGAAEGKAVARALLSKVSNALSTLSIDQIHQVSVSFQVFPKEWEPHFKLSTSGLASYLPAARGAQSKRSSLIAKRAIDIVGSLCGLTLLSPVFVAVAVGIKLTSKGPILFRQQRVGQHGCLFTFLKFRSMFPKSSHAVHEQYVKALITGTNGSERQTSKQKPAYKLTDDPRVTPIGKILRRTSIDELPQLINVLKGDMSLVGPRPPIPYEVDCYDIWHRRRLLEVRPGITGLWQVSGRSSIGFDEMVRLDLNYASSWSLWLDIKILLKTPGVVLGGKDAY